MATVRIYRINYKSDFILTLHSDAGWMTPFCIKFWTGAPSQAYYASFDGTDYTNCAAGEDPKDLTVQFDDHGLPIGDLKFQVAYHFTVADFPNDTEDEVINQANITTEIDGQTYQVMLDFNGETAPEIEFSLPAYANEAQRIENEQTRIANEETRVANEEQRVENEQARVEEYADLKADAVEATAAANDAAALANQKAQLADDAAALATQKAGIAQTAATDAENVNATLSGTTLTVTDRNGHSTSKDVEGPRGEQGIPGVAATIAVGTVTTGQAGSQASIVNVGTNNAAVLDFTIPKGDKGDQGIQGEPGNYTKPADGIPATDLAPEVGTIFDISVYNASGGVLATYANLTAALGTNGANVPEAIRKGGMSVRFVQTSDNNYVQYRYMSDDATTASTFTNVNNWQGVDATPTEESKNLIESGGVYSNTYDVRRAVTPINTLIGNGTTFAKTIITPTPDHVYEIDMIDTEWSTPSLSSNQDVFFIAGKGSSSYNKYWEEITYSTWASRKASSKYLIKWEEGISSDGTLCIGLRATTGTVVRYSIKDVTENYLNSIIGNSIKSNNIFIKTNTKHLLPPGEYYLNFHDTAWIANLQTGVSGKFFIINSYDNTDTETELLSITFAQKDSIAQRYNFVVPSGSSYIAVSARIPTNTIINYYIEKLNGNKYCTVTGTGDSSSLQYFQFNDIIAGHTYVLSFDNPSWDSSEVSSTNKKFTFGYTSSSNVSKTLYFANGTGSVSKDYSITVPTNTKNLYVGIRANAGTEVRMSIKDVTDLVEEDSKDTSVLFLDGNGTTLVTSIPVCAKPNTKYLVRVDPGSWDFPSLSSSYLVFGVLAYEDLTTGNIGNVTYTYSSFAGITSDGVEFTTPANTRFIKVQCRAASGVRLRVTVEEVSIEEERSVVPYSGNKVEIRNTFSYKKFGIDTLYSSYDGHASQSMAIWNGYLFQLFDGGYVVIFTIDSNDVLTEVSHYQLACAETSPSIHCNACEFAPTIDATNDFPYLYVADGTNKRLFVEKVTLSGSETMQIITHADDLVPNISSTLYSDWVIGDDGYLWRLAADSSLNRYMYLKMRCPLISEGNVELTSADVLQTIVGKTPDNDYLMQSMSVMHGQLYNIFGENNKKHRVDIYNTFNGTLVNSVSLDDIMTNECEGVYVYNGKMYISMYGVRFGFVLTF